MSSFSNLSKVDSIVEFTNDSGELIQAVRRSWCYDVYVESGGQLKFAGRAYTKAVEPRAIYQAWLDKKAIDEFFNRSNHANQKDKQGNLQGPECER